MPRKATNAPLKQFNMPPELNLPTEPPPQFTECVSTGGGEAPTPDSREMARRLQDLIEQIQGQPNPAARALLQDCLQSLLAFYGDGLARILSHIHDSGAVGREILERIGQDQTVNGLLLIHGLHPVALETRLRGALEKVRPYMQSHGGNIELLSLENEVARVRLEGTCKSCPSSAITLELAVRRAVDEACPDLMGFEVVTAAAETAA
jgi:Fe-S cluster biogenesis protein NfuA